MKPQVVSEKPVTCFEAKSIIETIEGRDGELSFRSGKTKDYLNEINHLTTKQAEKLYKELAALEVNRLKDVHIVKIIDIMPVSEEDLKSVLLGYNLALKSDVLKKILDVLATYRK